jgi:hypothetical protein
MSWIGSGAIGFDLLSRVINSAEARVRRPAPGYWPAPVDFGKEQASPFCERTQIANIAQIPLGTPDCDGQRPAFGVYQAGPTDCEAAFVVFGGMIGQDARFSG